MKINEKSAGLAAGWLCVVHPQWENKKEREKMCFLFFVGAWLAGKSMKIKRSMKIDANKFENQ